MPSSEPSRSANRLLPDCRGVLTPLGDGAALARRLVVARATGSPIRALNLEVSLSDEEAYTVQQSFVELWCARYGTQVRGYKVTVPNNAEPTYGALFAEDLLPSPAAIELNRFNGLMLEPELVFLIDEDVSSDLSRAHIVKSCRVAAGFELPELRYSGGALAPGLQRMDRIADNAGARAVVIGDAVRADSVQLDAVAVEMRLDGHRVLRASTSAMLADPLDSVRWLAARLAAAGQRLTSRMIVASGAIAPLRPAEPGRWTVEFQGIGRVEASFR